MIMKDYNTRFCLPKCDTEKKAAVNRVCRSITFWLFVALCIFVAATPIVLIITLSVFRWQLDAVDPQFYVDSATAYGVVVLGSVDDSSSTSTPPPPELTATWNITLLAINPNSKLAIDFSFLRATIYYGPQSSFSKRDNDGRYVLATKQLPDGFSLYPGNQTLLSFTTGVVAVSLVGEAGKEVVSPRHGDVGSMKLGLRLVVVYNYRPKIIREVDDSEMLEVFFDPVEFLFSPKTNDTTGGVFTGQERPPRIELMQEKNDLMDDTR